VDWGVMPAIGRDDRTCHVRNCEEIGKLDQLAPHNYVLGNPREARRQQVALLSEAPL